MEKINFPQNTFSKCTLNFDTGYFDFLKSELRFWVERTEESFKERIVRHTFAFSLIDVHLEKIVYVIVKPLLSRDISTSRNGNDPLNPTFSGVYVMICYHSKYFVTDFFA